MMMSWINRGGQMLPTKALLPPWTLHFLKFIQTSKPSPANPCIPAKRLEGYGLKEILAATITCNETSHPLFRQIGYQVCIRTWHFCAGNLFLVMIR